MILLVLAAKVGAAEVLGGVARGCFQKDQVRGEGMRFLDQFLLHMVILPSTLQNSLPDCAF